MKDSLRDTPFPTTRWTLVARISEGDPAEREAALGEACSLYWPPVYAFIRSQGYTAHDAEDLTQGFFAVFLEGNYFAGRNPADGRLRSYLLASVRHWLSSESRRAARQKRGGGIRALSLDAGEGEARCQSFETVDRSSPDRVYERQWAATVLENALRRLEERYRGESKAGLYRKLAPFLRPKECPPPQKEIAEELGLTPSALRVAIFRIRQRYQKCLLEEVVSTLPEGESPEDEVRYLRSLFS